MDTIYLKDLSEWHAWLLQNYLTVQEVWLVFYKKGSDKPCLNYTEAVEEALCFGWIDSLIKNRDEQSYLRKFTPRKTGSRWSELNIERAQKMIAQGRMTSAGQKLFEESNTSRSQGSESRKAEQEVYRDELIKRLSPEVKTVYLTYPPSHQRQYAGWVMSAKKEETRVKRIEELSLILLKGEKLGLK